MWKKPIYSLKDRKGKKIQIDVTTSVSAGLPPNKIVVEKIIPLFKNRGIESVIDFGAGALRHTLPLLDVGFQVCICAPLIQ